MDTEEIMQDMFDLMANERIKLEIEGEINSVVGTMYILDRHGLWQMVAATPEEECLDTCLGELLHQYENAKRQDTKKA